MLNNPAPTQPTDNFGVFALGNFKKASAVWYYRIEVPLRTMLKMGLAHSFMDDGSGDRLLNMQAMMGSDIVLTWALSNEHGHRLSETFTSLTPTAKDNELLIPPALVVDMDDANEYTSPFNPAFASLGLRNWNGDLLVPGDELLIPGRDGPIPLWVDKETRGAEDTIFDVARNIAHSEYHYEIFRNVHGVTVTCDFLKDLYVENGVNPDNIHVFPNSIIESDYEYPNLQPHEGIRLLWEGGSSHFESWLSIKAPLLEVLKKNPHVTLVVWGDVPKRLKNDIPEAQLEMHPWVDYNAYKFKRAVIDCDINLCPLVDSPFTRSKSAIRWYEASLGPRPEASLLADVGPYQEAEDGETGMLYKTPEEFAEKLQALIDNAELRKKVATGARKWVLANRDAEITVPKLFEFYEQLKVRQRQEALSCP